MVPSKDEATKTLMPSVAPGARSTMRTSDGQSISPMSLAWASRLLGAYTTVTVSGNSSCVGDGLGPIALRDQLVRRRGRQAVDAAAVVHA